MSEKRIALRCSTCCEVFGPQSILDSKYGPKGGVLNGDRTLIRPPLASWSGVVAEAERRGFRGVWREAEIGVLLHRHFDEVGGPYPMAEIVVVNESDEMEWALTVAVGRPVDLVEPAEKTA